jgi:hypothetical protein
MIRLWLTFIIFAGLIHLSITSWRALSGKEKWGLTKTAIYSIVIAMLAAAGMILLVFLF